MGWLLLCTSRHRHSEIIRIEVTHVCNRRLCLVKGTPTVDDLQSTLWTRGHHAHRGMDPLLRRNIRLSSSRSGGLLLLGFISIGLGWSIGATTTPDEASSPISSTFEGPLTGISSSRDALASLGAHSKMG